MKGVPFSTDGDSIHGSVYIFVDPVIRRHARKSTSGGSDFVDGDGHPREYSTGCMQYIC